MIILLLSIVIATYLLVDWQLHSRLSNEDPKNGKTTNLTLNKHNVEMF